GNPHIAGMTWSVSPGASGRGDNVSVWGWSNIRRQAPHAAVISGWSALSLDRSRDQHPATGTRCQPSLFGQLGPGLAALRDLSPQRVTTEKLALSIIGCVLMSPRPSLSQLAPLHRHRTPIIGVRYRAGPHTGLIDRLASGGWFPRPPCLLQAVIV